MINHEIQTFTNRELGLLLNNLTEKVESYHIETLNELVEIKTHTQKTNGRVSLLENWRNYIVGAIAVIAFLIPLVIKIIK